MWSILLVGFFNSSMFTSIFTLEVAELGPLTGDGSGVMSMAIVGGAAIPWIVGEIGPSSAISTFCFSPSGDRNQTVSAERRLSRTLNGIGNQKIKSGGRRARPISASVRRS
jgi:hypothetical protein